MLFCVRSTPNRCNARSSRYRLFVTQSLKALREFPVQIRSADDGASHIAFEIINTTMTMLATMTVTPNQCR